MKRATYLAIALAVVANACGGSSTSPSNNNVVFSAQMLPANETAASINGGESTSSGTVTITFVPTKDAAGNITNAAGTAAVTMQGFPSTTTITLAHIHTGATGVAGGIFVPFIPSGNITPVNGAASFSQSHDATGDQLTAMMNNPSGFYFNVHTAANPAGVMRGQLARVQ
jgi:hypothetical protein